MRARWITRRVLKSPLAEEAKERVDDGGQKGRNRTEVEGLEGEEEVRMPRGLVLAVVLGCTRAEGEAHAEGRRQRQRGRRERERSGTPASRVDSHKPLTPPDVGENESEREGVRERERETKTSRVDSHKQGTQTEEREQETEREGEGVGERERETERGE